MRSQPIVLRFFYSVVVVVVVVYVVDVVFVVVVVPNFDVVVYTKSKVDLRLLVKEVEFGWCVCKVIFVSNPTSFEVKLG